VFATSALLATLSVATKNGRFQAAGDPASGAADFHRLEKDRRALLI